MTDLVRPGGELATRPLHFIFIADCSTSMKHSGKMDALNQAIRDALPDMRRVADENPNAEVLVRAIAFSSGAHWVNTTALPVNEFEWQDLEASGVTDLGAAIELLSAELKIPPMSERALPPVLVLISDGMPTDDYQKAFDELFKLPWGIKAVKLAIGIGKGISEKTLKKFINNDEIDVLKADRAEALTEYIKWASTAVLQAASSPASQMGDEVKGNVYMPQVPDKYWEDLSIDLGDVW